MAYDNVTRLNPVRYGDSQVIHYTESFSLSPAICKAWTREVTPVLEEGFWITGDICPECKRISSAPGE